jgi:serine/tyrosine/threonine adenylyltransferase
MLSIRSDNFRKEFTSHFTGEDTVSVIPRQTPGVFYSKAIPTPVKEVKLLGWSDELAAELGLIKPSIQEEIDILGGNGLAPGMDPYAARYGGHQFGNWAGQLGDGRAITLGEWIAPGNRTYEFQLKGAGPTAYSRRADGRAVLRSSVREYLMSEAMHYLGIPTTRALSLVTTGDQVLRDMFYNGNPAYEPGAIVLRVAPSFLRFGNFEIFTAKGEFENLRMLADWTISKFFPHITGDGTEKYLRFFEEVVESTAKLMVQWLRVGFVHGVMNTDNMSVLGLTIDYGPYSFMDDYDPAFTPNTTDLPGRRYAFGRQPSVGYWNLGCLANALVPLFNNETKELESSLGKYEEILMSEYHSMMAGKLGLDKIAKEDAALLQQLEEVLAAVKPDMTIFYQLLSELPSHVETQEEAIKHFEGSFYTKPGKEEEASFWQLVQLYQARKQRNTISEEESKSQMRRFNPRFILRNYLLHEAIEALEKGSDQLFKKLEQAMKNPYSSEHDEFLKKRPDWASSKAGCSMLSCSS